MLKILIDIFQLIGLGLVMLLPLANPITTVALLLGLSENMTTKQINHESLMASIYVFAIMIISFYIGQVVMSVFGISLDGLRIAGGLIVAHLGFKMLFPMREVSHHVITTTETDRQDNEKESIAFIPLAMPGTAGPGTIALIITTASSLQGGQLPYSPLALAIAPVLTFLILSILLWVCLRCANTIMKWIGKSGIEAIARIMGFLLVCMGVQFIINGIIELSQHALAS